MGNISLLLTISERDKTHQLSLIDDFFHDIKTMGKIKEISSELLYTVYEEVTCLCFRLKVKCKRSCRHKEKENSSEASSDEALATMEDESNCLSDVD